MNGMTQMRRLPVCAAALLVCALLAGCGHKKNAARMPAPQAAPPVAERAPARSTERAGTLPPPGNSPISQASSLLPGGRVVGGSVLPTVTPAGTGLRTFTLYARSVDGLVTINL